MCIYVPFTMISMYVCVILPDGLVNDPASRQIFEVHSMLRIGMHMSNDIIIYRCPWWIWYQILVYLIHLLPGFSPKNIVYHFLFKYLLGAFSQEAFKAK